MEIKEARLIKETEYTKLFQDSNQTIGITHHKIGLGKLRVTDRSIEYGVPIIDVNEKSLSGWRIEKK